MFRKLNKQPTSFTNLQKKKAKGTRKQKGFFNDTKKKRKKKLIASLATIAAAQEFGVNAAVTAMSK